MSNETQLVHHAGFRYSLYPAYLATGEDPRRFGKSLVHGLSDLWRYHIRGYRVICNIEGDKLIVLIVRVAHRKDVYD